MGKRTGAGLVYVAGVALLLVCGCAGADELDELGELEHDQGDEAAGELEQPQVDCRPVRLLNCSHPWNDRACFRVPPACSVHVAPE
jgi:hypothetical protein